MRFDETGFQRYSSFELLNGIPYLPSFEISAPQRTVYSRVVSA
jgi:hypothetical protein